MLKYWGKRRADAVQERTTGTHLKRVRTPCKHGKRGDHLAGDVAAKEEVDERLNAAAPGREKGEGRLADDFKEDWSNAMPAAGRNSKAHVQQEEKLHLMMSQERCSLDMF